MLYGCLIGYPVSQSPSHITHNALFRSRGIAATYQKIAIAPLYLKQWITQARGFDAAEGTVYLPTRPRTNPPNWLAVTMPFKEMIIPCLDSLTLRAQQIGAVNTVFIQDGHWQGDNCDGIGALTALEKKIPVQGKSLLLLGSGGTARAIAHEAKNRGAFVSVWNRTPKRAEKLCEDLEVKHTTSLTKTYDIVVNATNADIKEINLSRINHAILDVRHGAKHLSEIAESRGLISVGGKEMFAELSVWQLTHVTNLSFSVDEFLIFYR